MVDAAWLGWLDSGGRWYRKTKRKKSGQGMREEMPIL